MSLEDRADVLIALVRDYQASECREILEAARVEARRQVADAYRRERARLHARVISERSDARARIQAVRAERDTRIRASGERANARLLELAWPLLSSALETRWRAPTTRRLWIGSAIEQARAALPPGHWTIRHPPDWPATERGELSSLIHRDLGASPTFLADDALSGGLVIEGQGVSLDVSLEGLLHDRRRLEARLLALMAVPEHEQTGATP